MALHVNKQEIIRNMITEKLEWTSEEIQQRLDVSPSWVVKYKFDIENTRHEGKSISIVRAAHKPHKPHKQHAHKGNVKDLNKRIDWEKLDFSSNWDYDNWVQVKVLTNYFHLLLNIPVPFQIEGDRDEGYISSETLDLLYKNLKDSLRFENRSPTLQARLSAIESIKRSSLLGEEEEVVYQKCLEVSEQIYDKTNKYKVRQAKNILVYLDNIIQSYILLITKETNPTLLTLVRAGFKELYPDLEPSEEQVQVVVKGFNFATGKLPYRNVSIQADAGSSKSHCSKVLQHLLHDTMPYISAITNKALNGVPNSKTVASLLQQYADIEIGDDFKLQMLKASSKASSIPFLIVDESSQVGDSTRRILEIIADRILYLGDQEQLPPIKDKAGIDYNYLHTLTKQYRFIEAEDDFQVNYSLLNKSKHYLRAEEYFKNKVIGTIQAVSKFRKAETETGYETYSDFSNSFENYIDLLKQYQSDDHQIIVYSQNAVDTINAIVNEGKEIKLNSKVMLTVNDYTALQYNGFQYRVIEIKDKKALCKSIETGAEYWFNISDLVLAYAMTTMKSQGSRFKHVLGITDTFKPYSKLDRYVIVTRASHTIRCLTANKSEKNQELIIQDKTDTFSINSVINKLKNSQEGSRNNTLYGCTKDLIKLNASDDDFNELTLVAKTIGLTDIEIQTTIDSAKVVPTESIKTKKSGTSKASFVLDDFQTNPNPRLTQYFTPVFKNHKTLLGKDRILSKEEAMAYPDILYIAEELKGSNRIVIDCDSKETVELFSEYLSQTESYVSTDKSSAHLVFTTDKLIRSSHKEGIDLLGNTLYTLRNIKDNKVYNDLKAIPLTQEILDLYENL